jgi:hypothetical protein
VRQCKCSPPHSQTKSERLRWPIRKAAWGRRCCQVLISHGILDNFPNYAVRRAHHIVGQSDFSVMFYGSPPEGFSATPRRIYRRSATERSTHRSYLLCNSRYGAFPISTKVYRYALPRAGYVGKRNDTEDGEPRKIGLFRKASFPIASRRERDDPEGEANPKGEGCAITVHIGCRRQTTGTGTSRGRCQISAKGLGERRTAAAARRYA